MKYNFIQVNFRNKNTNNNNSLELFKLSAGNNLKYNNKKNIGKMIYKTTINKETKILNEDFILNNMKRIKIILNNKQYGLVENIENKNHSFKIKIIALDNIIYLNSMFKDCKTLSGVYSFQNLNIKYSKTIYDLFYGCNSLVYIDVIIFFRNLITNNISFLFYECSSFEILPDISKWNLTNANNIS